MTVALVTGGTSGIGAAFARSLAAQGNDLVLVARSADGLDTIATELRAGGTQVETIQADLSVRADVSRVAARIEDTERPIELLVNNAGFGIHSLISDSDLDEHDRGFEVMIRAVLVLSGAAARAMTSRGHGHIVNVSSTAGYMRMGSYSSMKSWATAFTESLAVELRGTGVGVTALLPGWVRTEFHGRAGIRSSSIPNFMWQDAEQVVTACLRDVRRGKIISIPSLRYRVIFWLVRHAPRRMVRWVSGAISSNRRKPVSA